MNDKFKFNFDSPAKLAALSIRMPELPPAPDYEKIARDKREREVVDLGYAHIMYERLIHQIQQFEATLKPNEETAAYLASFGTQILVTIETVGYHNPYFITLNGTHSETGHRVRLVQHVSQINILLVAVSIPKEEGRKRRPIGFYVEETEPKAEKQE